MQVKTCTRCEQTFPVERFNRRLKSGDERQPKCKDCERDIHREQYRRDPERFRAKNRAWARAHPERMREYKRRDQLRSHYGITQAEYDALFSQQQGLCGICGREGSRTVGPPLDVDHDHVRNRVRGLLCNSCNRAVGLLGDSIEGLERALAYLRQT